MEKIEELERKVQTLENDNNELKIIIRNMQTQLTELKRTIDYLQENDILEIKIKLDMN